MAKKTTTTTTRTCPPSTPVADLRPGDRVSYQTERMDAEAEDTIVSIGGEIPVIRLESGRELVADLAWIRKIESVEPSPERTLPATAPKPSPAKPAPKRMTYTDEEKLTVVTSVATAIAAGVDVQDAMQTARDVTGIQYASSAFYRWRKQFGKVWEEITGKSPDTHVRRYLPPPRRKAKPETPPGTAPAAPTQEQRRPDWDEMCKLLDPMLSAGRFVSAVGLLVNQCHCTIAEAKDFALRRQHELGGIAQEPGTPVADEPQEPCTQAAETVQPPEECPAMDRMRRAQSKLTVRRDAKRLRYAASRMREKIVEAEAHHVNMPANMAACLVISLWDDQDVDRHGVCPDVDALEAYYRQTYEVPAAPIGTATTPERGDLHELVAGVHALADLLQEHCMELVGRIRGAAPDLARAAAVIDELEKNAEGAA